MQGYIIQPWDNAGLEDPDMSVPSEVLAMAEQVVSNYDMTVFDMTLITAKADKGGAIWKIHTNRGNRSLKLLHRAPSRSLFSIHAQDYMVRQGARVPALIRTKSGEMFVNKGGKSWIVTDWIEPLVPASKVDIEGAKELCYALGEFHRLSAGYSPPFGAYRATRLHRWPRTYEKIYEKIGWFRILAEVYSDLPGSSTLLSVVDRYEKQAGTALHRLQNSPYARLVSRGESYWGIVHQDYGWSNSQKGPGGMWIIDLDGVAFDLPIRDLRKLIGSTMADMGVWDIEWIKGMIEAYHEANPIEADLYEVLLIDLSLPNEFYKEIKEMVYDPAAFLTEEIASLLTSIDETDKTKWPALEELSQIKGLKMPTDFEVPLPSMSQVDSNYDSPAATYDDQPQLTTDFEVPLPSMSQVDSNYDSPGATYDDEQQLTTDFEVPRPSIPQTSDYDSEERATYAQSEMSLSNETTDPSRGTGQSHTTDVSESTVQHEITVLAKNQGLRQIKTPYKPTRQRRVKRKALGSPAMTAATKKHAKVQREARVDRTLKKRAMNQRIATAANQKTQPGHLNRKHQAGQLMSSRNGVTAKRNKMICSTGNRKTGRLIPGRKAIATKRPKKIQSTGNRQIRSKLVTGSNASSRITLPRNLTRNQCILRRRGVKSGLQPRKQGHGVRPCAANKRPPKRPSYTRRYRQ